MRSPKYTNQSPKRPSNSRERSDDSWLHDLTPVIFGCSFYALRICVLNKHLRLMALKLCFRSGLKTPRQSKHMKPFTSFYLLFFNAWHHKKKHGWHFLGFLGPWNHAQKIDVRDLFSQCGTIFDADESIGSTIWKTFPKNGFREMRGVMQCVFFLALTPGERGKKLAKNGSLTNDRNEIKFTWSLDTFSPKAC